MQPDTSMSSPSSDAANSLPSTAGVTGLPPSSLPSSSGSPGSPPTGPLPPVAMGVSTPERGRQVLLALVVLLCLAVGYLWQKLEHIQSELARASTDTTNFAMEARATAKAAQESARDTATRLGVTESRLAEVSLQRSQLEELMQSLSRSRDENLVVDVDAAVRLAQQQSQMLGSAEPLMAALKTAELRIQRTAQPRLAPIARAIARDMDRLKTARILDMGQASLSLDEVSRMVDELPLAHDPLDKAPLAAKPTGDAMSTVLGWGEQFWAEVRRLIRVSRIDTPDAALLSPSQGYFARENLKLRLLNARMGLLSRQLPSTTSDLKSAQLSLSRFFDPNAKSVALARERLTQVQAQLQNSELPRLDETLTALATAAAGK